MTLKDLFTWYRVGQNKNVMIPSQEETYYFLLSAARRALLGEIVASLRGVAVEWQEDVAHLYFYIDGEVSVKLHDDCTSIGAEVVASFSKAKIYEHINKLEYPNPLPKHSHWAFKRHENLNMDLIEWSDYEGLFHSAQYCLLDKVLPSMRGVAVKKQNQAAALIFYIDGPVNEDIKKICEDVAKKLKYLNPTYEISLSICSVNYPTPMPKHGLDWIYLRKESPT